MPVELLRHYPANQHAQLLISTGSRQAGATQVVRQVEVRVVDPDRPAEGERHEMHALPVYRRVAQIGMNLGGELVV